MSTLYLSSFTFPDGDREWKFFMGEKRTCFDSYYPFGVLSKHGLTELTFEPVTILYGGNGSGKTTALNVMAQALGLAREARFNQSSFLGTYVDMCSWKLRTPLTPESRVITSDDVFDYMLGLRAMNEGIDRRRDELLDEYFDDKYAKYEVRSLADYEKLRRRNLALRKTQSQYVRSRVMGNIREQSNGESAYFYFTQKLQESGLYLLDEPENSLSPLRQQELVTFLEESARFFGCQLIIATHSPFLLSMRGARIYDLDADPVCVRRWTQLENVRAYHDFFRRNQAAFDAEDERL